MRLASQENDLRFSDFWIEHCFKGYGLWVMGYGLWVRLREGKIGFRKQTIMD